MTRPEPSEQSFYLRVDQDTAFVTAHRPPAENASGVGVILCPPFGWEEVSSYRPRRVWAQELAGAGHTALRVSLPSTGDSGGRVRDPDRLTAWTSAIDTAAAWLRGHTGADRIVAIGMDLGGMLAYRSAALGAEIDDLVLWSVTSTGRAFVRRLRAFSRLEASQFFAGLPQPPALGEGELEAAGFILGAGTVRDLERLDLAGLELPGPAGRRVLMLERDGIAVDTRLRDRLAEMGVAVTIAAGPGYADMSTHPQFAGPPTQVFAAVAAWIAGAPAYARPAGSRVGPGAAGGAKRSAQVQTQLVGDTAWSETPVTIEWGAIRLAGILTSPRVPAPSGLCAVLLNAGGVRRIGPSRMWVQTARRWAQRGIPVLRLDAAGIGDADGPGLAYPDDAGFYQDELTLQVCCALDYLQDRGSGDRFLLVGLCSGAYWALHACLDDERVSAAAMVNSRVLIWDDGLAAARYLRALFSRRPSLTKIREVVTPAVVMEVVRWLLGAPRRRLRRLVSPQARAGEGKTDQLLEQLVGSGKRALFVFSEREPLHDELLRSGRLATLERAPTVTVEHIAVNDHTLRPSSAQLRAQQILDGALDRELEAGASASVSWPTGRA